MLEFLELGSKALEEFVLGIFLKHVVEEANACNQLFCVLFSYVTLSNGSVYKIHEVVMTTEIEVVSFLYFAVNHFRNIEMI